MKDQRGQLRIAADLIFDGLGQFIMDNLELDPVGASQVMIAILLERLPNGLQDVIEMQAALDLEEAILDLEEAMAAEAGYRKPLSKGRSPRTS